VQIDRSGRGDTIKSGVAVVKLLEESRMDRIGFVIVGVLVCAFGAWLVYFFSWGNAGGRLIDVPGYVRYFFAVVGFAIIGGGTAFFKMGKER
jgi:hypothetical protein